MLIYTVPLLAPAALFGVALWLHLRRDTPPRAGALLGEAAALVALAVSVLSLAVLIVKGAGDSPLLGLAGMGLSSRVDVVSVTMLGLVAFIGWVVMRYSRTYLDGEQRQTDNHVEPLFDHFPVYTGQLDQQIGQQRCHDQLPDGVHCRRHGEDAEVQRGDCRRDLLPRDRQSHLAQNGQVICVLGRINHRP